MAAGFPAGKGDGHHMVNKSKAWAVYLEVGNRSLEDEVVYPDIDLALTAARHGKQHYTKKNGEPYCGAVHPPLFNSSRGACGAGTLLRRLRAGPDLRQQGDRKRPRLNSSH